MVKPAFGYVTGRGRMFADKDKAEAAEKEEQLEDFTDDLMEITGLSPFAFDDEGGTVWGRLLFDCPEKIVALYKRYGLIE